MKNDKTLICSICGKVCNINGIKIHTWRVHTNNGLSHNTHKNYCGGKIAWNKGITGDTAWNKGLTGEKATFYGKKHTQEYKDRMAILSRDRMKRSWENGCFDKKSYESQKIFSSKNERIICEYIKTKYPEHNWKSGGRIKYNGIGIVRDLYSDVLKICFEYDGIWHFKNIKGQLIDKQIKDKCLEKWCIENNYRLIRIDENQYTNLEQIERLIYNTDVSIIKIGNRY